MTAVTIAEVAARAGVSVPTVSKVLNGRRGVGPGTRQAVELAVAETGYQRRRRAGPGIVDLLIPGIDSQWAIGLVRGVNAEAQDEGLDVIITTDFDGPEAEPGWLDRVARRGSEGVIVVVSELSQATRKVLSRRNMPVVLLDPVGSAASDLVSITAANWAGGLAATEHLLTLGHRRVGIITGPEREVCSADRLDGWGAAHRRAGLAADPALVRHGDSLGAGGRSHGGALLDLPDPPTAIFSCSDEQAYGVYEAARDRGLRVPDDVSVVGFDDVALCQWVSPQLTTVRQPLEEMGAAAVRRVSGAAGPVAGTGRYELPVTLVVRQSTAPPRTAKTT
ncbi:MAG: substrate-binding domain-containing protein [Bifidobacteriaceae bacterium]|jgi:LacI family transcriptional regulator|nr:substrate-binding domain-containing protein [Bifidobacteriaceae bacterium]